MIENFVIFLKKNIMKKRDQIKQKMKLKEINYLLIKKENKMIELLKIIQKVNKKKKK